MAFSRHAAEENFNEDFHKITVLDGLKQAELQCNNLRQQLRLLGNALSTNYENKISQRENGGGEGLTNFIQEQLKTTEYNSEQSRFTEEEFDLGKNAQHPKPENYIRLPVKPQVSSEDVEKRKRKSSRNRNPAITNEVENSVFTLFKKTDRQSSFVSSDAIGKRSQQLPLQPQEQIKRDGDNNVPGHQLKVIVRDNVMPFVVGTSTSRSHNICLNFQEVLAKLKRRQPVVLDAMHGNKSARERPPKVCECKSNEGAGDMTILDEKVEKQVAQFLSDEQRSKKFKDVLRNLYMEFTSMTQEYEKLLKAYSLKESNKLFLKKQLKTLDRILGHKEDEIIVLISMYREVISMKEAVTRKVAPEARSQPNPCSFSSNSNLRLKVLLQQIRKLQAHLSQL